MSETNGELRLIPLDEIRPWPGNPRKTFHEQGLAELAESIKSKGLLQPILLRPHPAGVGAKRIKKGKQVEEPFEAACGYEIAAGERRWRAARLAGLQAIEAKVRSLSDQEMMEIAVIENEQREEVSPLEKADGYAALVEVHGVALDQLAAKIGKSVSTIRGLLRLRQLPESARRALAAGTLAASVAELVAARPSEAMREKVALFALVPRDRWGHPAKDGTLPSYREVKDWIRHECMIELKQAPFRQKEEGLGGAGACTSCPKRTGNARQEYPDGREDLCTDPGCYRAKVEAWQEAEKAKAAAAGQKMLGSEESAKLFPYNNGDLAYSAPYFDLADQCQEDRAKKTPRSYKQLLEGHLQPEDVVLAHDQAKRLHRLVSKDVALPILRDVHGLHKDHGCSSSDRTSAEVQSERAKVRAAGAVRRRGRRLLLDRASERGEAWGQALAALPGEGLLVLRTLAAELISHLDSEPAELLCRGRGMKSGSIYGQKEELVAALTKLPGTELLGLLAELAVARSCFGWNDGKRGKELLKAIGMTPAEAEKQAKAELAAKRQGAKKKPSEAGQARRLGKKLLAAGGAQ